MKIGHSIHSANELVSLPQVPKVRRQEFSPDLSKPYEQSESLAGRLSAPSFMALFFISGYEKVPEAVEYLLQINVVI